MSLKVIGAGFGRTGTLSLKHALEELGFVKCYHMVEVMENRPYTRFWNDYVHGRGGDLKAHYQGYQATVDWPGCAYYKELLELFPEAKVLLNVRDLDKWYDSMAETILKGPPMAMQMMLPVLRLISPKMAHLARGIRMSKTLILERTFRDRKDRQTVTDAFEKHIEAVQAHVPADRLLVYEVKQGWEPLCGFLDVPVPEDKPFPRVNQRSEFANLMKQHVR